MKKQFIILLASILLLTGCSKIENCPNCKYSFYLSTKILKEGTAVQIEGLKPSVIKDYKDDYEEIISTYKTNVFLGNVLDREGNIIESYVCSINKNKPFCINNLNNPNLYKIFGKNNCIEYKEGIQCSDEVSLTVTKELVNIFNGDYTCSVDYIRGSSSCSKRQY